MTNNKFIKIIFLCVFLMIALAFVSAAEKYKLDPRLMDIPVEDLDFCCFDVNSNGDYLIGFTDYEGGDFNTRSLGKISIYNSDGDFVYGYSFNTKGSFDAFWDEGDISIFLYREDILVTVDRLGMLIESEAAEEDPHLGFKTKTVAGTTYKAKTGNPLIDNDENASSGQYSMLIKISSDGQETVLYENLESGGFNGNFFFVIVAVIIAVAGAAVIIILVALKNKK